MRFQLDVPGNFFRPDHSHHNETVAFYNVLQQAALRLDVEIGLQRAAAPDDEGPPPECPPGSLRYVYHARACGPRTHTVKMSALPGLWHIDSQGYSGWSRLAIDPAMQAAAATFDRARADQAIAAWRNRFLSQNISKYAQPHEGNVPLPGFVFYPLQVNGDRVLDLLALSQLEILARLGQIADRPGRRVVIKRHPLCTSAAITAALAQLAGHPLIEISGASVHRLIAAARGVLVANSGVGLEALIHGRPVLAMAASEYRHMALAIDPATDLERIFDPLPEPTDQARRQLGWLLAEELLDPNDPDRIAQRLASHLDAAAKDDAGGPERPHAEAVLRETLRRQIADGIGLVLSLPESPETEVSLLRALRLGISREHILRRAPTKVIDRAASMFFTDGDMVWARRTAQAALARDVTAPLSHLTLARIAFREGDNEAGMAALRQAVASPAASGGAHLLLARRLQKAGASQRATALLHARASVTTDPEVGLGWLVLAQLAFAADNRAEALAALDRAEALMPSEPKIAALRSRMRPA